MYAPPWFVFFHFVVPKTGGCPAYGFFIKIEANRQERSLAVEDDPPYPTSKGKRPTPSSPAHNQAANERWIPEFDRKKGMPADVGVHVSRAGRSSVQHRSCSTSHRKNLHLAGTGDFQPCKIPAIGILLLWPTGRRVFLLDAWMQQVLPLNQFMRLGDKKSILAHGCRCTHYQNHF
jgi:hypothetical protein